MAHKSVLKSAKIQMCCQAEAEVKIQMKSDEIRWHQMKSDEIRWNQLRSDEINWDQMDVLVPPRRGRSVGRDPLYCTSPRAEPAPRPVRLRTSQVCRSVNGLNWEFAAVSPFCLSAAFSGKHLTPRLLFLKLRFGFYAFLRAAGTKLKKKKKAGSTSFCSFHTGKDTVALTFSIHAFIKASRGLNTEAFSATLIGVGL